LTAPSADPVQDYYTLSLSYTAQLLGQQRTLHDLRAALPADDLESRRVIQEQLRVLSGRIGVVTRLDKRIARAEQPDQGLSLADQVREATYLTSALKESWLDWQRDPVEQRAAAIKERKELRRRIEPAQPPPPAPPQAVAAPAHVNYISAADFVDLTAAASVPDYPQPWPSEPLAGAEVPEDECCSICLDRRANVVAIPCGHSTFCVTCTANTRPGECPLCREACRVKGFYRVFK
jgi:hypothetical protein